MPDATAPILTQPPARIGHNNPPSQVELIQQGLLDRHAKLITRKDDLLAAFERTPETIADEETAKKIGDFIDQFTAACKVADSTREAEKEPYLSGCRAVDGWFKAITEPMTRTKATLNARLKVFLDRKAAAERERLKQLELEKLREAEAARRKEAEAAEAAALAAETNDVKLADQAVATAVVAADTAKVAEAQAIAAGAAADAKPAEHSRIRGDLGSVKSLKLVWKHRDLDKDIVDLEKLRPFLKTEHLDMAIRAYIAANKPTSGMDWPEHKVIVGVTIYPDTRL